MQSSKPSRKKQEKDCSCIWFAAQEWAVWEGTRINFERQLFESVHWIKWIEKNREKECIHLNSLRNWNDSIK